MACIQINNLNYTLPCGKVLFADLNLSLHADFYSLLGDNGSGKSTLAKLLAGKISSGSGTLICGQSLGYLPQLTRKTDISGSQTVAQFLGIDKQLAALARISLGGTAIADFELIGDNWLLAEQTQAALKQAGLDIALEQRCRQLSGGEFTRLRLLKLLAAKPDFLILDEPSNHLDSAGKAWLKQTLAAFGGGILLISHDRELLMLSRQTLYLHRGGVSLYGGNYLAYERQYTLEQQALERRLKNKSRQLAGLQKRQQVSAEKAQKREQSGQKNRRGGNQAKVLLDFKKNKAQAGSSGRQKQNHRQMSALVQEVRVEKNAREIGLQLKIKMAQAKEHRQGLLTVDKLELPFTRNKALSFVLAPNEKLHLHGANGSGKSTLLKLLSGRFCTAGEQIPGITMRARPLYFDQFFSQLAFGQKGPGTMLETLQHFCPLLSECQSRGALASVGFRGHLAEKPLAALSGGELAKLTIAIISRLSGEDLLLLDEPDNHLDIGSKDLFARALSDFNGSFILVSHDAAFLAQAGINRTIALL